MKWMGYTGLYPKVMMVAWLRYMTFGVVSHDVRLSSFEIQKSENDISFIPKIGKKRYI